MPTTAWNTELAMMDGSAHVRSKFAGLHPTIYGQPLVEIVPSQWNVRR